MYANKETTMRFEDKYPGLTVLLAIFISVLWFIGVIIIIAYVFGLEDVLF